MESEGKRSPPPMHASVSGSMFQSAVIHAEYEFTNHNAVINAVCYNRHQDCFVSTDDTCLRLWAPAKDEELRHVNLPARTTNFIQALEYIESRQVYVAAALDGTLKMYDLNLCELASVFTGRGTILSMVFDAKHNRLLTGGVDGCAAWLVRGKPLGAAENGINPHYELSPIPNFFTVAAAAHRSGQEPPLDKDEGDGSAVAAISAASKRNSTRPGVTTATAAAATASGSSRRSGGDGDLPHQRAWVQNVLLNSAKTKLYAQSKHCVDVFSAVDGHYIETYSDLFPKENGAIMAFVVHEKTQYVVCGCINGWIFVVSLHPSSVVHVFKDHTMSVTSLTVHTSSNLILSSSLDGTVRLWDLDARRQAHRLDIGKPVQEIQLLVPNANPCRFYCQVRSRIQLFRIQSTIKEHLPTLSPICILQRVLFPVHASTPLLGHAGGRGEAGASKDNRRSTEASDDEASFSGVEDDASEDDDEEAQRSAEPKQVIVAAGMNKTIRLFAGRAANEAPSFTWIPEETSLDLIGFALHPARKHLFLLLASQMIVVVDVNARDKVDSCVDRIVDMNVQATFGGRAGKSSSTTGCSDGGSSPRDGASAGGSGRTKSRGSAAIGSSSWSPRGGIRCICVCYYPPVFRSTAPSAFATASVTPAAQSKWFSRTFVNRRQPSALAQELKRADEKVATHEVKAPGPRRNALIQSEYEWIVCGSEFGDLLFWHTGMTNSGKEAVSIDAHDAGIVTVATSTSSPLLVSLDEANRVNLWHCQPVFMLRHSLDLSEKPSCFVLSPTSELLLTGYDDGNVIFMDVSDPSAVETFSNDENHFAMVSAADFLDEKAIVLTASVDAMIKIWDQEKHLLRQVTIAIAFTSLCFMNPSGDVMAGLSNGIFIVTRGDVLPEKVPKQTRRKDAKAVAGVPPRATNQKEDHGRHAAPVESAKTLGVALRESALAFDKKADAASDEQGDKRTRRLRVEEKHAAQPNASAATTSVSACVEEVPAAMSWKKSAEDLTKWLTYVDRPLAVQHPPVLRPLNNNSKLLPDSFDRVAELRACKPKTPMRSQVRKRRRQLLPAHLPTDDTLCLLSRDKMSPTRNHCPRYRPMIKKKIGARRSCEF